MKEKEKKAGRNIKEIQDKSSNFQITGTDEWEEFQINDKDHNFSKIMKENHPKFREKKTYTYRSKRHTEFKTAKTGKENPLACHS